MKSIGELVHRARCERDDPEKYQQEHGHPPLSVRGIVISVFTTTKSNLQFNVTLDGDKLPTIKFDEQSPSGKFVVGVAATDGGTIVQDRNNQFRLNDPLSRLIEVFPDNPRMKKFVECLLNSR